MKTNFQLIRDLEDFWPKNKHFITEDEIKHISDTLCLKEMDELGLRNMRDFVVMLYGHRVDELAENEDFDEEFATMDKMSGIVSVIDNRLFNMGCAV